MDRAHQLREVAKQLEMQYTQEDEWGAMELINDFKLFRKGGQPRIFNVLQYSTPLDEIKVNIFDYRYVAGAGKSRQRHYQTVFFVQSKELMLPEFWMKPETLFHKLGSLLGLEDINFAEYPEFSTHYHLKGEDEALIRHTFNKEVLHYFTIEKQWCLEGVGYFFILYKPSVLFPPKEISTIFTKGVQLWDKLKQ